MLKKFQKLGLILGLMCAAGLVFANKSSCLAMESSEHSSEVSFYDSEIPCEFGNGGETTTTGTEKNEKDVKVKCRFCGNIDYCPKKEAEQLYVEDEKRGFVIGFDGDKPITIKNWTDRGKFERCRQCVTKLTNGNECPKCGFLYITKDEDVCNRTSFPCTHCDNGVIKDPVSSKSLMVNVFKSCLEKMIEEP